MLGVISENGTLHFHYHHINTEGQIRAGKCDSIPKILLDGRIVLHEKWQWLDGRREAGKSIVEEMVR